MSLCVLLGNSRCLSDFIDRRVVDYSVTYLANSGGTRSFQNTSPAS